MESYLPALAAQRTRQKRVCAKLKKKNEKDLLGALALRVQADESRACERWEERLILRVHLVKVTLRETVLLHGGGVLAPHDLAAVGIFLFQGLLHHQRELILFASAENEEEKTRE